MSANATESHEVVPDTTAVLAIVEHVTEALANTSIATKETSSMDAADMDAADVDAAHAAHAASAAEGRRLYIGNLAYSTTDDQLKEFFAGFDIESTSIPTNPRSGRAVGYAFVDLKTKEEAERAIAELSGKEVLERKVSVQLARKPGTASAKRESHYNTPAPVEGQQEQQEDGEQEQQSGGRRNGGTRGRGRRRGRGGRSRGDRVNGTSAEGTYEEGPVPAANILSLAGPSDVWDGTPTTEASGAPTGPAGEGDAPGGFRVKRRRGPPENGVPSATKVMVANLPYELSEEKLKELFAEYQPESAKIALRPIPRFMVRKLQARGEPRKGRGFGFVTLASEELQKRAVEEMNGKDVEGREIAVKVAIDNPKIEGENEDISEVERKKGDVGEDGKPQEAKPQEAKLNGILADAAVVDAVAV